MTNEQRVQEIHEKINVDEHLESLFIDNRPFIVKIIKATLKTEIDNDVLEDLIQSQYFSLLKAVYGYNPDKGKFLTYFSFAIKTQLLRRDAPAMDIFNNLGTISIDTPIKSGNVEELTLGDTIEDRTREPVGHMMELEQIKAQIWETVNKSLDSEKADYITKKYKEKMQLKEIADSAGVPIHIVKSRVDRGLFELRHFRKLNEFRGVEFSSNWEGVAYNTVGFMAYKRYRSSATERAAFKKMGIYL